MANLKNDYSVWGERTGISGIKIPVHYRYAIDIKPENVHFPDGTVPADKINDYCKQYEQMVNGNVIRNAHFVMRQVNVKVRQKN